MKPVQTARLAWVSPESVSPGDFEAVRRRLERVLQAGDLKEVAHAKLRTLYRASDDVLGPLAIKEMRNESPLRRFWLRWVREHSALRELRVGSGFVARGGRAPAFLGAAMDRDVSGLDRVLVFMRWIEAPTLTAFLAARTSPPGPTLVARIASQLVQAGRLGLVHGRHSSNNLLVTGSDEEPVLYTIDFAYSRLEPGFHADGFIHDVARIARWLRLTDACSETTIQLLFAAVAREAFPDPDEASIGHAALTAEMVTLVEEHAADLAAQSAA